jgi:hypothetical protein
LSNNQGKKQGAGVVQIKDAESKIMMVAASECPWFCTSLPAGQYTVTASMTEKVEHQKAEVTSAGHEMLYFYWSE